MASLSQITAEKLARLESIPAAFLTALESVEITLLQELIGLMGEFELKGGLIILNEANLVRISAISNQLNNIMFEGEYLNAMTTFVSEFETQALLTNDFFVETFGQEFTQQSIFDSVVIRAQRDVLTLLDSSAIGTNLMGPLQEVLNNSVSTEQTFAEAIKQVRGFMTGQEGRLGQLRSYAGVFVTDIFNNADRRYTNILSEEFESQWFLYVGGLVRDSRVFCVDRAGQVWHKKEIEAWGAGKMIGGAGNPWQGKNPATDPQTIFVFLGGFNCLHSLLPVAPSEVSEATKDRARAKGFIT